ncbi:acetoin utilization transport system permease protein [Natronobacillus azotifigens]|uniref:FtsX-like permease family protein n=1 Tax=Natronobacillus azotifigens TaxID=472978 RepID=A0A9J6RBK2_9BACI|nr:ABC transporter permease [Natronobacillus azotifigens]MCZ0702707.1 FtsX-like permease family protein [Natronobacillus azotifigens]
MTGKDKFRFVRQNMKKSKMRIFMTVLASAMACTFLIVLASVGFGLHQTVLRDVMEEDAINEISIYGTEDEDGQYRNINKEDVEYFRSLDDVRAVSTLIYLNQQPEYIVDTHHIHANTRVSEFFGEEQAGIQLEAGELPSAANEIIVGYHFLQNLSPIETDEDVEVYDENGNILDELRYTEDIIGQTVSFTIEKYMGDDEFESKVFEAVITGITEQPAREWVEDTTVYITEEMLASIESYTETTKGNIYPEEDEYEQYYTGYDDVYLYSHSLPHVEALTTQLQDEGYYVYSVASQLKEINILFNIAKAGLIFIGTIAVLIASIGIYNTMTMAVTERAPDIGIMKAIGASPKTIKQIFLLESTYIGLLGALFGTIVAYIISYSVNFIIPLILEGVYGEPLPDGLKFSAIPWTLVVIAVTICLIVTIISGSRPAKKATKIDVLKAMRREI